MAREVSSAFSITADLDDMQINAAMLYFDQFEPSMRTDYFEPIGGITRAFERARYLGSRNLMGLGDLNRDCLSALGNFVCIFS